MSRKITRTAEFIDEERIDRILETAKAPSRGRFDEIIARAREAKGIPEEDAASLLQVTDAGWLGEMYAAAREIKEKIYGKRLVLFAPLYVSDFCVNNCRYCGYRRDNRFPRRRLTLEEVTEEVRILEAMGHKRLALECGEDPVNCPIDYVVDVIRTIYETWNENGNIRRVNVNIAATTVDDYRRLKDAKIGTYVLFQETYHRATYRDVHSGPKQDYDWHTTAHDRAMEAGIDDVGLGVLFGLSDYRFEVLGLLEHAAHLEKEFGVGPHTISVPRLRPALGVDASEFPCIVGDDEFRRIVAVLRLAVPYTGMILSTREKPEFRDQVIATGISQISAGSCTGVGGYSAETCGRTGGRTGGSEAGSQTAQFNVEDRRSPDEIIRSVAASGYIPSYCTACYRQGRTGDRFMALARTGEIQNVCAPNAILTFKEFLIDYASEETKNVGEQAIREHMAAIPNENVRRETERRLKLIEAGRRDLYF
ncbi:MAG: [FeFe] hydrogenase H-cluster radical SAM maturase HydG [Firmicutes bacterium]|nr:[FeFe] hydrogenase H-cluster radical SAM maturase HydG [Bacillota bacterium]